MYPRSTLLCFLTLDFFAALGVHATPALYLIGLLCIAWAQRRQVASLFLFGTALTLAGDSFGMTLSLALTALALAMALWNQLKGTP